MLRATKFLLWSNHAEFFKTNANVSKIEFLFRLSFWQIIQFAEEVITIDTVSHMFNKHYLANMIGLLVIRSLYKHLLISIYCKISNILHIKNISMVILAVCGMLWKFCSVQHKARWTKKSDCVVYDIEVLVWAWL